MTPERLEIARRLVRCKGWEWMPGMGIEYGAGCTSRVLEVRVFGIPEGIDLKTGAWCAFETPRLPDLDNDLTRLGILAVVRKAWGIDTLGIVWCVGQWYVQRGSQENPDSFYGSGPTEEAALLVALESAP